MKTGIIYISKHGTTEKVARIIVEKLDGDEIELINLRKDQSIDIGIFDRIIIGGSIHVGSVHKRIKKFCELNNHILLTKTIGLFLCCMEKGKVAIEQFENAFPEDLRLHASSIGWLGYEYNLEKMNFLERAIVKKISGSKESISEIDNDALVKFVGELEKK